MKGLLEIAAFNISSALLAVQAGADRIEICDNQFEGGTSPSYGTVKLLKQKVSVPVFAMVRVRGGDFLYNDEEIEVMKKDLQLFKQLGCEGVVLGFLKADGLIDVQLTRRFVDLAFPMDVTFHRAFDRAKQPLEALEILINCGCQRILTSGQMPTATLGSTLIKKLIVQADDRIIIMPGAGVRSNNISHLQTETGAVEFHSAARTLQGSPMEYINDQINESLEVTNVDAEEIGKMRALLVENIL